MNYLFSKKDLRRLIIPLVFEQALAITVGMADTDDFIGGGSSCIRSFAGGYD